MNTTFSKRVAILFLAGAAACLCGCTVADTGAFVRLQEEVESLKQEMGAQRAGAPAAASAPRTAAEPPEASVTEQDLSGRVSAEDMAAFRRSLADLTNSGDELRTELRAQATRSDEIRTRLDKEVSRLTSMTNETAAAVQELRVRSNKVSEVDRRLAAMEERIEKIVAASRPAPGASAPSTPVPTEFKSPEDMYDFAQGTLKNNDVAKARELFDAFIAKYPGHRLLPNAYYWRGETFYVQKDFENAILAFQDVIDKFGTSDKVPDALFKQGLSFQAMNDRKSARTIFELVVSRFPKHLLAEKAKQKLNELK